MTIQFISVLYKYQVLKLIIWELSSKTNKFIKRETQILNCKQTFTQFSWSDHQYKLRMSKLNSNNGQLGMFAQF